MQQLPRTVEDAADLLYGRAPGEFVAARDELANALKEAGQAALAREVKRLRRPSMSAWALNLLARREPERLSELIALGPAIGRAQRLGRLDELRSLGADRADRVAAIVRAARSALEEHGHQMSSDIALDIETTLAGALADEETAKLVLAGQLERPVEYAGLGPAPMLRLVPSLPAEEVTGEPPEAAAPPEPVSIPEPDLPDLVPLREAYEAESTRHAEAIAAADQIDDQRASLRAEYDELRGRLKDLEASLRDADRAANEALREIGRADRDLARAKQALDKAEDAHARAARRRRS